MNDNNNYNYNNQNQNYNNQNPNYNNQPYNQQYNPQYNQQYNPQYPMNNYTQQDAESDKTKLILGIVFLVIGFFFSGLIFGTLAIVMSTQIKKKSGGKTALLVLGIIEIVLVIISLVAVFASLLLPY